MLFPDNLTILDDLDQVCCGPDRCRPACYLAADAVMVALLADGQALVGKPAVEFLKIIEPWARCKQPFPDILDTCFSTWPFSQPEPGVQATGSTR